MFARIVSAQVQPGQADSVAAVYQESILPEARNNEGFRAGFLLVTPAGDKLMSITLWNTEEDLRQDIVYLQRQIRKVLDVFVAPPVVETFEVSVAETDRLG